MSQSVTAGVRPLDSSAAPAEIAEADTLRRLTWFVFAMLLGIAIAGFWNAGVVDGFGRDVATQVIGGYEGRAADYGTLGSGFGFLFALVAGVAATFTACNCVAFALLPGLACAANVRDRRRAALNALGIMAFWVAAVGAVYGAFVGRLGPEGAVSFNVREIRSAQSFAVFGTLGLAMLVWGMFEFGLLKRLVARCSPLTRGFFTQANTKAAMLGMMIGAFMVGRPYPVFREFLLYAAQARRPGYGAALMAVQGLGQILVMAALFVIVITFGHRQIERWVRSKPHQPAMVSAVALVAGGSFFLYYWAIVRLWPELGRWGFRLGIYQ